MAPRPKLQLKIREAAFTKKVKKRIEFNMKTLAAFIIADLKQIVATPYPPASRVGESPHKRTGTLQQGFEFRIKTSIFAVALRIFTNVPYSRRLEFGFVGTDALGRNVNQGPRPYWRVVMARAPIGVGVAKDP
jgi:hypothetical protein